MDDAIQAHRTAVSLTPKSAYNRSIRLLCLANTLQARYQRTRSLNSIDEAIEANEEAVDLLGDGDDNKGMFLSNLGNALHSRFLQVGLLVDLHAAIKAKKKAVDATADDHPHRGTYLNNLGNALHALSLHTLSIDDINAAVEANESAVACTPKDHPDRGMFLFNLGIVFEEREKFTGTIKDRDSAIVTHTEAAYSSSTPPSFRISSARRAAAMMVGYEPRQIREASQILRMAVELLPNTSRSGLNWLDQQYALSKFSGLASEAAAFALESNLPPADVVRLLDSGRGIISGHRMDIRTELKGLPEGIAEEHERLQRLLDPAPPQASGSTRDRDRPTSEDLHQIALEFEQLKTRIRALEGFRYFGLPLPDSELSKLTARGPIVLFNVHGLRSDAFLIEKNGIRCVQLLRLNHAELEDVTSRFIRSVDTAMHPKEYAGSKREMLKILEWLWDVVVEPVLAELGFTQVLSDTDLDLWPRVWWIASGLLTVLPIHAAGYHTTGFSRTALDRVISSYAPTLKSLAYARVKLKNSESKNTQTALIVAMPKTKDLADLPFVQKEVEVLQKLLPPTIQSTFSYCPMKSDVLSLLPNHQVVHLACHGKVSPEDPSQSKIFLSDWQSNPLTVSELTQMNIPACLFAYLSACHTSSTRNVRLLDESISLSSVLQLAGYSSVVGTLWQIHDEHSPGVAKEVYSAMLHSGRSLDTEQSAVGLHQAVRILREKTCSVPGMSKMVASDPLIWAPYIHLGV